MGYHSDAEAKDRCDHGAYNAPSQEGLNFTGGWFSAFLSHFFTTGTKIEMRDLEIGSIGIDT